MKILNGSELTGFIKERQLRQSRSLRQSCKIKPRLAIIRTGNNQVTDVYLRLKQEYGKDVEIEVDVHSVADEELFGLIKLLNNDKNVHGIIIQLPLSDISQTEESVRSVDPKKDVDGLSENPQFVSATATAIDWLLAGYNVELGNKKIAIVGKGRLVGAPLAKLWKNSGFDVRVCDSKTVDLGLVLREVDVIVTSAGVPGLVTSKMIRSGAVVIDAGTASEGGKVVGDLANNVRNRNDISVTPERGGVGPLTVAALFDNVLLAARNSLSKK